MQLSMTIGSMAVVLGVVLAGGYALGEDAAQAPAAEAAVEKPIEQQEIQKRKAPR